MPDSAQGLIADYPGVTVAVYASPHQTVIAGPPTQLDTVIAVVTAQGGFARRVNVEVASHTALMDPILPELHSALADLAPKTPAIPLISTVTDAGAPPLDADYWVANVRQPVRLHQAISTAGHDHTTFIEISPHPMLTQAITQTLEPAIHHHSIGTLWRDGDDTISFHSNLNATAHQPPAAHPAPGRTPSRTAHHPLASHSTLDQRRAAERSGCGCSAGFRCGGESR